MLRRRTAIEKQVRKGWGGSRLDSYTHAEIFHDQSPTYFGMLDAQIFSSQIESDIINKPWVWLTEAQGNVYYTKPGVSRYCWRLMGKIEADARITRVDAGLGTTPGKGNQEFKIYLDRGWFHEPVLLKSDSDNAPLLRILGHPVQINATEWEYTVKLQTGDVMSFIDPSYLQVGNRVIDASTSVADELNIKRGGDYFANRFELESQLGYVGREIWVTDKFIRMEMQGKSAGMSYGSNWGGSFSDGAALGVGYTYQPDLADKTSAKEIRHGAFISMAEMRLGERLAEDKNMLMEFGQIETTNDWETGRQITVGAGWREVRRESPYYFEHSGNLTLFDLYEKLADAFNTVKPIGTPTVYLRTGRGGVEWFSRMVNAEAGNSPFVLQDNYFIYATKNQATPRALGWGAQFTEILMTNGLKLVVMYDPSKDNPRYYREKVPGTNYTYESFTFDVIDLGETDAAPVGATTRSNIAMVKEDMKDEYAYVGNAYDIRTGAVNNGATISSTDKNAGIYRESSVGLACWDVSRILSAVYTRA